MSFLYFCGLRPKLRKSKIVGIGILRGVQIAVCDMLSIHLICCIPSIKYSLLSQKKLKEEKISCNTVKDI